MGEDPNKNSQKNIAVGVCQTFLTATGRPGRSIDNGHISDRWGTSVDRPGRPKQTESTVKCPVDPSGQPASVRFVKTDSETRKRKLVLVLWFKGIINEVLDLINLRV